MFLLKRNVLLNYLLLSVILLLPFTTYSQSLVINEFMGSNSIVENHLGRYDAWIEIKNNGETLENLGQYYLSNDSLNKTAHKLPEKIVKPGEYVIVWLSGLVNIKSEVHVPLRGVDVSNHLVLTSESQSHTFRFSSYPFHNQSIGRFEAYPDDRLLIFSSNQISPGSENFIPSFWEKKANYTAFRPKDSVPNACVFFQGRYWTLEGWGNQSNGLTYSKSELWSSPDGLNWSLVDPDPVYHPFSAFTVFKDTLWAFGDTIRFSLDAVNWQTAQESFPGGLLARVTIFNDTLWTVKGRTVAFSANGKNWTVTTNEAPWTNREAPGLVAFNNKLWLIGGGFGYGTSEPISYRSDVWSTVNGIDWDLVTSDAGWPPRYWHVNFVFDNKMWMIGGWNYEGFFTEIHRGNKSDTWYSSDGVTWEELPARDGWEARHAPFVIASDSTVLISSGYGRKIYNDVWTLTSRVYYSKPTGELSDLSTWGSRSDGSGDPPPNFSQDRQILVVSNRTTVDLNSSLQLDGIGAKLIIGSYDSPIDFHVTALGGIAAHVDILNRSTFTSNSKQLPKFNSLDPESTVILDLDIDSLQLPVAHYGNLTIAGTTRAILNDNIKIEGQLTIRDNATLSVLSDKCITSYGNIQLTGVAADKQINIKVAGTSTQHINVGKDSYHVINSLEIDKPSGSLFLSGGLDFPTFDSEEAKNLAFNLYLEELDSVVSLSTLVLKEGTLNVTNSLLQFDNLIGGGIESYLVTHGNSYVVRLIEMGESKLFPIGFTDLSTPADITNLGTTNLFAINLQRRDSLEDIVYSIGQKWDVRTNSVELDYTLQLTWNDNDEGDLFESSNSIIRLLASPPTLPVLKPDTTWRQDNLNRIRARLQERGTFYLESLNKPCGKSRRSAVALDSAHFIYGDSVQISNFFETKPHSISLDNSTLSVTDSLLIAVDTGEANLTVVYNEDETFCEFEYQCKVVVTKRTLVADAGNYRKAYNEPNPQLSIRYNGFTQGDDILDIDHAPEFVTNVENVDAGTYVLYLSGGMDNHYEITYDTGTFIIEKGRPHLLKYEAEMSYGDRFETGTIINTNKVDSVVSKSGLISLQDNALVCLGAGSDVVKIYAAESKNFFALEDSLKIKANKKTLSATPRSRTKVYKEPDNFEITYHGFIDGDSSDVIDELPQFEKSFTDSSSGTYALSLIGGFDDNYNIVGQIGSLVISKRALSAKPNRAVKVYGDEDPMFTMLYSGFAFNESAEMLDQEPVIERSSASNDAGVYTLHPSGGDDDNYFFVYDTAALVVAKRELTVSIKSAMRKFSQTDPHFEILYDGFVFSDSEIVLDNIPKVEDFQGRSVGEYELRPIVGLDNNYLLIAETSSLKIIRDDIPPPLYPNPATDHVYITIQEGVTNDFLLVLLDHLGQNNPIHKIEQISGTKLRIDVGKLAAGHYVILYSNGSTRQSFKLIIK